MGRQAIGTGDGAEPLFALVKTYTDAGGYQSQRRITRPVPGSVRVWVGGAEALGGFTVAEGGVVCFAATPGAGVAIEAECAFDVPARFDTDQMKVTIEAYGSFSWGQIPVVEVKE